MPNDEESSFTELGDLMKKIKAIESIARHHENAVTFHTRASQKALQEAEKARAEVKLLRELYKTTINKFAAAFSENETLKEHKKHARVDSTMDADEASWPLPKQNAEQTTATDTSSGKENKPMVRAVLRSPQPSEDGKSEIRTLRISQTDMAFSLFGGGGGGDSRQNASSEYTTISSSFVQRVAKRKESLSALQSMNPVHHRSASDPTRTVYVKPVQKNEKMDEQVDEQIDLESELEHIKAFL